MENKIIDKKNRTNGIISFLVVDILGSAICYFYKFGPIATCILIGTITTIIVFYLNWIGFSSKNPLIDDKKNKKDILNKEKEEIKNLSNDELKEQFEHRQEILEFIKDTYNSRDKYQLNKWIFIFLDFCIVVFFMGILFSGSMDPNNIYKSSFEDRLNQSLNYGKEGLQYATSQVIDAIQILVMRLYSYGQETTISMFGFENIRVFYWMFWITIIYWIGYLYLYKIIFNADKYVIKEIIIPIVKKTINKIKLIQMKGGQRQDEQTGNM